MLALALVLQSFRYLVYSHPCVIVSDCSSLLALLIYGKATNNSRLARLLGTISCFPIKAFIHTPSLWNKADLLTRKIGLPDHRGKYKAQIQFNQLEKTDVNTNLVTGKAYTLPELSAMAESNVEKTSCHCYSVKEKQKCSGEKYKHRVRSG